MKRLIGGSGGGNAAGGVSGNTQVQFNDNGAFGGDADLTWNKTTNVLGVTGDVNLSDGSTYTTTLQTITPTAARTISLPDATGTVALVAGSSGQLVYNNAGAYAGVSTMTFSGNNVTLAGRLINSYTSVADSPAKVFTGTWFTGGTATTNKPHFLIEPTGTTSTAWSTSGTGLGVNAASGFTGRVVDFQVNGTSRFTVAGNGNVGIGTVSPPSTLLTLNIAAVTNTKTQIFSGTDNTYCDYKLFLSRGTSLSTSTAIVNTAAGNLTLETSDVERLRIDSIGSIRVVTALTVATLPGTPAVGMIARVTDASAPAMGSIVAGGGAAAALVWYNGTNWRVIGV